MDLISETVLDCSGRPTHRLRLDLDGNVKVVDARGNHAVIDPVRQASLTPGASISPQVMETAVRMAAMGLE